MVLRFLSAKVVSCGGQASKELKRTGKKVLKQQLNYFQMFLGLGKF